MVRLKITRQIKWLDKINHYQDVLILMKVQTVVGRIRREN